MKILVVNDDSIYAPGIKLLAEAAAEFGKVWVVAPVQQCSAMSHKISIGGILHVEKVEDFPATVEAVYKVDGSPADCVKVALQYILEEKPDYVFSGINNGYNVGYEIAYSGTMAAAMEAIMNGIPSIAFSNANQAPLTLAQSHISAIIQQILEKESLTKEVWNVNFPFTNDNIPKGVLYNRTVAPVWLYNSDYQEVSTADTGTDLAIHGIPITNAASAPVGSDLEAVLQGYISIGKVHSPVL